MTSTADTDPTTLKRRLDDIQYRGRILTIYQVTLASNTQTVVTKQTDNSALSSNSFITFSPYSAQATYADITRISPGKDTFTIFHTSPGATSKIHNFLVLTGWKTSNEP